MHLCFDVYSMEWVTFLDMIDSGVLGEPCILCAVVTHNIIIMGFIVREEVILAFLHSHV